MSAADTTPSPGARAPHELDAPPWLRVEATLMATARLIRHAYDVRLASLELNLTQASLLAYVADFGPVTQTQIADHLGMGRPATGTSIDRLQDRGLLRRVPNPEDRRVWQIEPTAEGVKMVGSIARVDEALRTDLRTDISRDERHGLTTVLNRLQANLQAAINQPSST